MCFVGGPLAQQLFYTLLTRGDDGAGAGASVDGAGGAGAGTGHTSTEGVRVRADSEDPTLDLSQAREGTEGSRKKVPTPSASNSPIPTATPHTVDVTPDDDSPVAVNDVHAEDSPRRFLTALFDHGAGQRLFLPSIGPIRATFGSAAVDIDLPSLANKLLGLCSTQHVRVCVWCVCVSPPHHLSLSDSLPSHVYTEARDQACFEGIGTAAAERGRSQLPHRADFKRRRLPGCSDAQPCSCKYRPYCSDPKSSDGISGE